MTYKDPFVAGTYKTYTCLKRKQRKNLKKTFRIWFTIGTNLNSRLANCRSQGQPLVGSWQLQRTNYNRKILRLGIPGAHSYTLRKDVSICTRTANASTRIISNWNFWSVPKFRFWSFVPLMTSLICRHDSSLNWT